MKTLDVADRVVDHRIERVSAVAGCTPEEFVKRLYKAVNKKQPVKKKDERS